MRRLRSTLRCLPVATAALMAINLSLGKARDEQPSHVTLSKSSQTPLMFDNEGS